VSGKNMRATGRENALYDAWLERTASTTALLYSVFIAVLLPVFHYVLASLPGVGADSLGLRLLASAVSIAVAVALLCTPRARRHAQLLQLVQVVVALAVIAALIVDSGDQYFYIASGLLVIIAAQNAFHDSRMLAAALRFCISRSVLGGARYSHHELQRHDAHHLCHGICACVHPGFHEHQSKAKRGSQPSARAAGHA
jgi:hypothetical protein